MCDHDWQRFLAGYKNNYILNQIIRTKYQTYQDSQNKTIGMYQSSQT